MEKQSAYLNMVGQKINNLLVLSLEPKDPKKPQTILCRCDCGREKIIRANAVKYQISKTCGKCSYPRFVKHGMYNTKLYHAWYAILERCNNPKDQAYKNYGGRGIRVCERWLEFKNFFADMGERPKGKSIDRIDNDGPYSPENCRWATREEQRNNTRSNRFYTYKGEKLSLRQWARRYKIDHRTLAYRLDVQKFSLQYALENKNKLKFQHTS